MEHVWSRIEAWLAANAPAIAAGLNPPASSRELAKTERFLGARLPQDVRLSYLRHNGQSRGSPAMFAGWEWYSLERVRYAWQVWKGLLDRGTFAGMVNHGDGSAVRKDWWHPAWIPVTAIDTGDHHCLDLAPGPQGTVGQVIEIWNDARLRLVVATSFREWLTDFADDLERGDYMVCQATGELDHRNWLWATLVRRADRRKQEGWHVALDLASQFGWKPTGTCPPRRVRVADWDAEDYTSRQGQQVTAADALALAAALGRALKAIPKGSAARPAEAASPAVAFFTGRSRSGLAGLVAYCKRGAFRITDGV
jgi:cell wall assembly regulator SMI1